jgi:AraC family transcriptional regulator
MQPRIEIFKETKLVGQRIKTSLTENSTVELWKRFMPRRNEIQASVSTDFYSVQVYDSLYFAKFDPASSFEKWAAKEVADFSIIPNEMEAFVIEAGQYAVFDYKGSSLDFRVFEYIFGTWLPNSTYKLDNRPHFQILGEKYKNADPESEEEIWIPIR